MLVFWGNKVLYVRGKKIGIISDAVISPDDIITFWVDEKCFKYSCNVYDIEVDCKSINAG